MQQTAVVTGGESGIGRATAVRLARDGFRVFVGDLRLLPENAESYEAWRISRQICDVQREADIIQLIDTAVAATGRLDVLVNNGGVSQRALAMNTEAAVERALMEVIYFGQVALTKAVLPGMRARRAGHIVVVSSVMGYIGTPGRSSYAAAKHALHGYFDSLRAEVWREGIKVTLACPGYVKTSVSANALGGDGRKHGVTDATHERGIPAVKCARAIVHATARGREEVTVGGPEVMAIYLKRWFPWLASRIIRRLKFVTK